VNTKNETIENINKLASEKVPFLFLIDFELNKPLVIPLDEVNSKELLYDFNGNRNFIDRGCNIKNFSFDKYPMKIDDYLKAFNYVQRLQEYGDSYLLNLTFPTYIETSLDLRDIFF